MSIVYLTLAISFSMFLITHIILTGWGNSSRRKQQNRIPLEFRQLFILPKIGTKHGYNCTIYGYCDEGIIEGSGNIFSSDSSNPSLGIAPYIRFGDKHPLHLHQKCKEDELARMMDAYTSAVGEIYK